MSSDLKTDSARSESSGTVGRAVNRAHGAQVVFDSSSRPQPDALTNSEAFLAAVSSCGVTLIEMHAREAGVPIARMAVSIEGSRDAAVTHYQSVTMRFEIAGVTQAQAEDLVAVYRGR
jgi:uncharacterized OsmC-like protein